MTAETAINPSVEERLSRCRTAALVILRSLTDGSPEAWDFAISLLAMRLTPFECAELARVARAAGESGIIFNTKKVIVTLAELDELALRGPGLRLMNPLAEARTWVEMATRDELKAYLWLAFERLGPIDRTSFLNYATTLEEPE